MTKRKILICGPPISGNKGGQALVSGTIKAITASAPNAEFTLLSLQYCSDLAYSSRYGIRVIGIKHYNLPLSFIRGFILLLFKKIKLFVQLILKTDTLLREYVESDIILNMTGIGFHEFFGKLVIVKHALWILPAIILRKPIIIYSQSMGPFVSRINKMLASFCLNRVKIIIARGKITRQYLIDLGISKPIYLCADSGFLLDCGKLPPEAEEMFRDDSAQSRKTCMLGVAINDVIKTHGKDRNYPFFMGQLLDYAIKQFSVKVVFIPHSNRDVDIAKSVVESMKFREATAQIRSDYAAEELKAIIGKCDLFIGSRFHAIVGALSMCVPTIAIGWSHKYQEVMEMFGQECYVFSFQDIQLDQVTSKIQELYVHQNEIKEHLESCLPEIKESVLLGGRLIAAAI
ncbi:polysaccharide pyruvyl transferase family protein [Candidatus Omnitrophota bacterium]